MPINKVHIQKLNKSLKEILNSELLLGNEIVDTGIDYPYKNSIWVALKKPFFKKHIKEKVAYQNLNDIRYWFE